MTHELNKLQCLKTYKRANIVFLKGEKSNYIEQLQMLIYLEGIEKPVYATKLNNFEVVTGTRYKMNRMWANIPFIFDPVKEEYKRVVMKDSEDKKLRKFLAKFNYKTSRMIYNEVSNCMSKIDANQFDKREKKPQRTGIVLVESWDNMVVVGD